jgi:hypothetical protein
MPSLEVSGWVTSPFFVALFAGPTYGRLQMAYLRAVSHRRGNENAGLVS